MVLDLGLGQEVQYKGQEAEVIDFYFTHDEDEQEVCILLRDGTSFWITAERLYEENPDLVVVDPPQEDEEDYLSCYENYDSCYEGYDDYDI